MGMLDDLVPFTDHFKEGQVFTLEDAKIGNEIQTSFGPSRPVMLKIGGKWYSVFGEGLTNQVERMDGDDRNQMRAGTFQVKVVRRSTKSGNEVKVLASPDAPDVASADDDIPF